MSDNDTEKKEEGTELAPGDITEFIVVFTQLNKGRTQLEATKALHEVVEAAMATGKKTGTVTIKIKVEPLESGAVSLVPDVTSNPAKDRPERFSSPTARAAYPATTPACTTASGNPTHPKE